MNCALCNQLIESWDWDCLEESAIDPGLAYQSDSANPIVDFADWWTTATYHNLNIPQT